jgi:hypothetical protein
MNLPFKNDPNTGRFGGTCTCPDGSVYATGDNQDSCGSLACGGGTAGACIKQPGPWTDQRVECGCPVEAANQTRRMIDQNYATENWRLESCKNPSEKNVVHEDVELPSSATSHVGGTCWCPDGQSYDVADTSKGSCEGGVTEPSKRHDSSSGPWSRRRVMCACPRPILELRARLAMRAMSNSTARHSRRPGSRRERRERRRAMEDAAVALLELPGETSVVEASQPARAQGSAECGLRTVEFTFTDVSSIPFTLTSRRRRRPNAMPTHPTKTSSLRIHHTRAASVPSAARARAPTGRCTTSQTTRTTANRLPASEAKWARATRQKGRMSTYRSPVGAPLESRIQATHPHPRVR